MALGGLEVSLHKYCCKYTKSVNLTLEVVLNRAEWKKRIHVANSEILWPNQDFLMFMLLRYYIQMTGEFDTKVPTSASCKTPYLMPRWSLFYSGWSWLIWRIYAFEHDTWICISSVSLWSHLICCDQLVSGSGYQFRSFSWNW